MRRRVGAAALCPPWLLGLALGGCSPVGLGAGIDAFSPMTGSARGGDRLEVVGALPEGARIRLGGALLPTEVIDGGVAATIPPGFAGPVEVAVVAGDEALIAEDAFTYVALDPAWVEAAAGYLPAGRALDAVALDLDDDGDVDVALVDPDQGVVAWTNSGHGAFEAAVLAPGDARALTAADLDGDGRLDLFACFGSGEPDRVGSAGGWLTLPGSSACTAAAVVDGDVVVLAGGASVRVWRNLSEPGRLRFALDEAQEPPVDVTDLAFPGGFGVGEVGAVSLIGTADGAGRLVAEATGPASVGALFDVATSLTPVGATVGASLPARLELHDATGEVFTWAGGPLASATFDGDGVFDPPASSLAVLFDVGAGPVDVVFDDVVLDVGVPVVLEDFARSAPLLAGSPGDGALAATRDGALCIGRGDGAPALRCARPVDGGWTPDFNPLPAIPHGVAGLVVLGDDLLLATAGQDLLLRGDGLGRYFDDTWRAMPVDATAAQAVTGADVDRDGALDVLIANDGQDRVLRRDGDRFVDWTARAPLRDEATRRLLPADVDGDGDLDLLVLGDGPPRLWVAVDR